MHFFPVLMFQHWVLAIFFGLIGVILTCLAFGTRWHATERREVDDIEEIQKESGIHLNLTGQYKTNPHGLFLLLLYFGVVLFYVVYYFLMGICAREIW